MNLKIKSHKNNKNEFRLNLSKYKKNIVKNNKKLNYFKKD